MSAATLIINSAKASYTVAVLAVLGVFAFVSATLIAWPALAYLGAKVFKYKILRKINAAAPFLGAAAFASDAMSCL